MRFRRFIICFFIVSILSTSCAFAAQTYVTCQKKVGTGYGTYDACCSGNNVVMVGYFSSSSEDIW